MRQQGISGLQIVHELSRGRLGHHPTRARLGGWACAEGDRERWATPTWSRRPSRRYGGTRNSSSAWISPPPER